MQPCTIRFWFFSGSILLSLLASSPTGAQIVPDTTLPNNSIVPPNCTNCEITGGTSVGNNLFHSFDQFSVPTGGTAYFNNAATIENIISRVTGNSISNINGLLRANGAANLFLLNPNGIIFGSNASLNIGGSFLATSADSFLFQNGFAFSARNPQAPPLLTINVPIGLQFGQIAGEIRNEGNLQVAPTRTLALVGGQINIPSGFLTASGGRIELGSVAEGALVNLMQIATGYALDYTGVQNFGDIQLQGAMVNASGEGGGAIQLQGRDITLTENSQVFSTTLGAGIGELLTINARRLTAEGGASIYTSTMSEGRAGNVIVRASDYIVLAQTSPDGQSASGIASLVFLNATGNGGNVTIQTGQLLIRDGAVVNASTLGAGRAGDVILIASDSINLSGTSLYFPSGIGSQVSQKASGNGGNVTIETRQLSIRDGAFIDVSTFGAGRAGNVLIKASDSVELVGIGTVVNSVDGVTPITSRSGIFAQVADGAIPDAGNAGNLTIETQRLTVQGGAQISTAARNRGNGGELTINASDSIQLSGTSPLATAEPFDKNRSGIFVSAEEEATGNVGNLNINTGLLVVENGARISADNAGGPNNTAGIANLNVRQLIIRNGGQVRAGSFGTGPGGTLNVNATESVQVIGSTIIGSANVPSELFTEAKSSGNAGNLNINTDNLSVRDGARVTLSSQGTGQAGELTVIARAIELDNKGSITTTTNVGTGGNIFLLNLDSLVMRRNSNISTRSGDVNTLGRGGNITIDTGVLAALENSDINANAFGGSGGEIKINAQAIFGIEARTVENPTTSDITARSELRPNLSGTITINTPDVDPSSGLIELPENFVDASSLVDRRCSPSNRASRFVVTGSGGLPASPIAVLGGDAIDVNWVTLPQERGRGAEERRSRGAEEDNFIVGDRIVEAQGWVKGPNGEVILTATPPTATPHNSWQRPIDCPAPQRQ